MTTDLAPIDGATIIRCETCGNEAMVDPTQADEKLVHFEDGSHLHPPILGNVEEVQS